MSIAHFEEMGYGIVATSNIVESSKIVTIPKKIILCYDEIQKYSDELYQRLIKQFNLRKHNSNYDDELVIAALLIERNKKDLSIFSPYIRVLPTHVPNLIHYNAEELEQLHDLKFAEHIRTSNDNNYNDYLELVAILNDISYNYEITYDDYKWASSVLDSRGLRFKGRVHLAPFADMFNYKPHPTPRKAGNGNFFLKHHVLSDKSLIIYADRNAESGDQLYEDYGDNSDQIYSQYHGFIPDENPFRCINVKLPALTHFNTTISDINRKMQLLQGLGFNIDEGFGACVDSSGDIGFGMTIIMTVIAFNDEETSVCLNGVTQFNLSKNDDEKRANWNQMIGLNCNFQIVRRNISSLLDDASSNMSFDIDEQSLTARVLQHITIYLLQPNKYISPVAVNDGLPEKLQLAIKYREHLKILWERICFLYKDSTPQETKALEVAEETLGNRLDKFNSWFFGHLPDSSYSKIKAVPMPLYRIGTIAVTSIRSDDIYLKVPTTIIIDSAKAADDKYGISKLVKKLRSLYKNSDDFHELLFLLLHEYHVSKESSDFHPYLSVLPLHHELDVPLLWSQEELYQRLYPSLLYNNTLEYIDRTRRTYQAIKNISVIHEYFSDYSNVLTESNYFWGTVILDSRSIWWEGKRHLVPMLDFVNCYEYEDSPDRVHSTILDPITQSFAMTKSPQHFKEQEQLFENYGQPNHIYFAYHGFTLPINSHDCVLLEITISKEEAAAVSPEYMAYIIPKIRGIRRNYIHKFVTCINDPVDISIYLYIALKYNVILDDDSSSYSNLITNSVLNEYLVELLDDRIARYVKHNEMTRIPHVASEAFLRSELNLLYKVKESLLHNKHLPREDL